MLRLNFRSTVIFVALSSQASCCHVVASSLLKCRANFFLQNISTELIGYFLSNQRCFDISNAYIIAYISKHDVKRAFSWFWLTERLHGVCTKFFSNPKWFIAALSIATTMEKRWKKLAFFSFQLTKITDKFGQRRSDGWTGNLTSTPGCVQHTLNRTVFFTIRSFLSRWGFQDPEKWYWSTMRFQQSSIMKTELQDLIVILQFRENESTTNRTGPWFGIRRDARFSRLGIHMLKTNSCSISYTL